MEGVLKRILSRVNKMKIEDKEYAEEFKLAITKLYNIFSMMPSSEKAIVLASEIFISIDAKINNITDNNKTDPKISEANEIFTLLQDATKSLFSKTPNQKKFEKVIKELKIEENKIIHENDISYAFYNISKTKYMILFNKSLSKADCSDSDIYNEFQELINSSIKRIDESKLNTFLRKYRLQYKNAIFSNAREMEIKRNNYKKAIEYSILCLNSSSLLRAEFPDPRYDNMFAKDLSKNAHILSKLKSK